MKKAPINAARNIWKNQLLKLYNPSNSPAIPIPVDLMSTGDILAKYRN